MNTRGVIFSLGIIALLAVVVPVQAEAPKSWQVIGYESFTPPPPPPKSSKKKKKPARTAVKVPKLPTSPPPVPKPKVDPHAPNPVSKAVLGVGAAVIAAAIGSNILTTSGDRAESALVAAVRKPVVAHVAKPQLSMTTDEGASIPNEVFNLVKAIVGVGVLSLPAGVAAFGSAPSAFIPAGILIAVIGILSGYGFALIGRVCAYTGAKSYRDAWARTVGESTSWIPAWSATCKTFLACLAFSMVLADTFASLLDKSRNGTLLTVTAMILTPLCLMKSLKSLAPFSLVGVLGMAYTALAMTVRWLDGTYEVSGDTAGSLASEVARHLRPKFGSLGASSVFSPNALILVCMLSTAYMVRSIRIHFHRLKTMLTFIAVAVAVTSTFPAYFRLTSTHQSSTWS